MSRVRVRGFRSFRASKLHEQSQVKYLREEKGDLHAATATAVSPSTSEHASSPAAPKLTRRTSQDPRHSPPLSPQSRTAAGAPGTRRQQTKRTTADSSGAASGGAGGKKGGRAAENNIVPPISVLIVDGAWLGGGLGLGADDALAACVQTTRSTRRSCRRS